MQGAVTHQSVGLVVRFGSDGQDLGGAVEAQGARLCHQVHDGLQRSGLQLLHAVLLRVDVHHAALRPADEHHNTVPQDPDTHLCIAPNN